MTSNQITYFKNREEARHNVASEGVEQSRAHSQALSAKAQVLMAHETERHNRIEEAIDIMNALSNSMRAGASLASGIGNFI